MEKTTIYEMLGFLIAFLGIGIAYFAIHKGIRLEWMKREYSHLERMKALELGRSLPGDGPWLTPLKLGFLIATVVPIGVFAFSCLATAQGGFHQDIWTVAGMVGVFAVVCGSVPVMIQARSGQESLPALQVEKPPVEDDAYDVVSARG
jgi:hypothetical protein